MPFHVAVLLMGTGFCSLVVLISLFLSVRNRRWLALTAATVAAEVALALWFHAGIKKESEWFSSRDRPFAVERAEIVGVWKSRDPAVGREFRFAEDGTVSGSDNFRSTWELHGG